MRNGTNGPRDDAILATDETGLPPDRHSGSDLYRDLQQPGDRDLYDRRGCDWCGDPTCDGYCVEEFDPYETIRDVAARLREMGVSSEENE